LMVAALLGWQTARRGRHPLLAAAIGLGAAYPVAIFVNAVRVLSVTQAHRWITPRLPAAYDAFVHQLGGMAIFLPSLIALNLLFQIYARRLCSHRE
jgi:exosortase/archaeosortase family protein